MGISHFGFPTDGRAPANRDDIAGLGPMRRYKFDSDKARDRAIDGAYANYSGKASSEEAAEA